MADGDFGWWPGTKVLRNKLGLRNAKDLEKAEYQVTSDRTRDAPQFPPTRAGYQALHRHLFSEVFEWAGELRTVNFTKDGTQFAAARFLDSTLDKVFADLAARNYLQSLTGERFAAAAAHHVSELNVIHPFREGNGRAMQLSLGQLAVQAGHTLDTTRMPGPAWIEASIRGYEGDEQPLARLIAGALVPARLVPPGAALTEWQAALEPARDQVRERTRAILTQIQRSGPSPRLAEEVKDLQAEMSHLRAARPMETALTELRDADGVLGVLAGPTEPARERIHALRGAVARGLVAAAPAPATAPDPDLPPADAALRIMHTLHRPATAEPAPWDAALTPLGPRLDAYLERRAQEAAAQTRPAGPDAGPAAAPDAEPAPAPARRPRDPSPGF